MRMNIPGIKAKLFPALTEGKDDVPLKNMDIMDHFEKIVKISQKYGIEKCLYKSRSHLDYITGKLDISPIQALLFSHLLEKSYDNRNLIALGAIAESIKCSKIRILKYIGEFEELEKKKLIRCSKNNGDISYRIPHKVCESLRKYNQFQPEKKENLSIEQFFTALERIFEERENNEVTFDNMKLDLLDLINQNMHLSFCKKILSFKLWDNNLALLLCFCHLFANNNDDDIGAHDFEFLYEDRGEFKRIKNDLSNGYHTLMNYKFISYNNSNGFANRESWRLSDMAKKELLPEFQGNHNYKKNLILSEKITHKKMYYNRKEGEAIEKLTSLLQEENYQKIVNRLDGKNMRKGFACLFSGGPGTGKTETAYQIARETKRNIFMVDISETKSMWYGGSEKRIKEIFDTYRSAVEKSEIAPILLFNEADAVIGKRKENGSSGGAIDQTENTIQNIILQEMENLSGILIATTNLTQNMDSAFERRFLYKITFEKPSIESRKHIWNILLPDLPQNKTAELSDKFELSGGQIENIARKIEVDAIINGDALCMDILTQYCKDESANGFNTSKKIGFGRE